MFVDEKFLRETLKEVFQKGWEGYLDLENNVVEEAMEKLLEDEEKAKTSTSVTTESLAGWEITAPHINAWEITAPAELSMADTVVITNNTITF